MKKIVLLCVVVLLSGCFNKVDQSTVVAKIGNKSFTKDDLDKKIQAIDDPNAQAF